MSVQTKLGVVREVGTELEEKGAKVLIDAVEIVLVHQCRRFHNPGIAVVALWMVSLFGPIDSALLLSFADEDNALGLPESGPAFGGHIVLTLAFFKVHDRNLIVLGELLNGTHKSAGHRFHGRVMHASGVVRFFQATPQTDKAASSIAEENTTCFVGLRRSLVSVAFHK